jgi:chemotaxis protein CheX
MSQEPLPRSYDPQHPYSSLVRTADRAKVLSELVTQIWDTAVGLPLSPVEDAVDEPDLHTRTAVVHLGGAWRGSVAITAGAPLADECASRMFQMSVAELSSAELQDSWGEMGNMIAGNLKALVHGPTQLSLPTVMEGSTYTFRVPRTHPLNELTYACHGHRLRVTVLRVEGDTPGSG